MTDFIPPDRRGAPRDDSTDSLREWRLRAYLDHLEDIGYDLDSGTFLDDRSADPGASAEASASRVG